jgi:ATP-dependent Zn protease
VHGHRGSGASNDVANATRLIAAEFNRADPHFGPSWMQVEVGLTHMHAIGSEAMRATAWTLIRARFEECWDRSLALVAEHRRAIEYLADALLDVKSTLTGEEIVALLDEFAAGETRNG